MRRGWQSLFMLEQIKPSSRSSQVSSYLSSTAPHRQQSTLSSLKNRLVAYHRRQHDGNSGVESDDLAIAEEAASHDMRWLIQGAKENGDPAWEKVVTRMVREVVEDDKPLAYVLGNVPFHPLPRPLMIRPPTLIPRPETEHWVGELATILSGEIGPSQSSNSFRILDIGTGSGCIPLALAFALSARSESPPPLGRPFEFVGVDVSPTALALAQDNLNLLGEYSLPVTFISADLFKQDFVTVVHHQSTPTTLAETPREAKGSIAFDLIISNPPYITESEYRYLDGSVSKWEDKGALVGGGDDTSATSSGKVDDGLHYYRRIIGLLPDLLKPNNLELVASTEAPNLVLEVGRGQAEEVARMIEQTGWRAEVRQDPWGIDRVVYGYQTATQAVK